MEVLEEGFLAMIASCHDRHESKIILSKQMSDLVCGPE